MIDTKEKPLAVTTYCYSYYRISSPSQAKGGGIKRQVEAAKRPVTITAGQWIPAFI